MNIADHRSSIASLREAQSDRQKFAEESEARNAEIEARLEEALERQHVYENMLAARDSVRAALKRATDEVTGHTARLAAIDREIRSQWDKGERIHDHVYEQSWRRELLNQLPNWAASMKVELARLEIEIPQFERENGITARQE